MKIDASTNRAKVKERLEELRQQYLNAGPSLAAATAYINGLEFEIRQARSATLRGEVLEEVRTALHRAMPQTDESECRSVGIVMRVLTSMINATERTAEGGF